jgi:hypothetical protein
MMNIDFIKPLLDSVIGDRKSSYDKTITTGKPFIVGDKKIYPIIILSSFSLDDRFIYESITPLALAVIDSDQKYFVSLDEENEEINVFLDNDDLWKRLGLEK